MLVLIIHLESAIHRRENVERLLTQFSDDEAAILPAVRGADLSEGVKAQWLAKRPLKPAYPFALNDGEIGCFLSHRAAWKALLDSQHESALILEDDAVVDRSKVNQTLGQIDGQDLVQLQTRPLKSGKQGLIPERPLPLRTTAQWLTRKAADRLLSLSAVLDRPVDTFVQMTWHHQLNAVAAYPSGVEEAPPAVAATTIQSAAKKSVWSKLKRNVQRSAYRRKVKALA